MRIVTFVKHVPSSAATPRISETRVQIEEEGLSCEVNETDLYAIEEALHQRTAQNGNVVAVTIGPTRAKDALYMAYAKGVDHAIHMVDDVGRGVDSILSVEIAAALLKKQSYDVIFTGIQADDDLLGRFGISLAEKLGIPVVSAVTKINMDPTRRVATVTRELGSGLSEELEVDLPCLFTIQFGIRPVRYTPIMTVVKARTRKIETLDYAAIGIDPGTPPSGGRLRVVDLAYPEDGGKCEVISGSPAEASQELMKNLMVRGVI